MIISNDNIYKILLITDDNYLPWRHGPADFSMASYRFTEHQQYNSFYLSVLNQFETNRTKEGYDALVVDKKFNVCNDSIQFYKDLSRLINNDVYLQYITKIKIDRNMDSGLHYDCHFHDVINKKANERVAHENILMLKQKIDRMRIKVFLSHSHMDKPIVNKLYDDLRKMNIMSWIDEKEINYGDRIFEKIEDGISTCNIQLVFLSKDSVKSLWVRREYESYLQDEIERKTRFLIPVLIDNVEIPLFMKTKRYVDFTNENNYKKSLYELISGLGKIKNEISEQNT
jgi:hypothetical protein